MTTTPEHLLLPFQKLLKLLVVVKIWHEFLFFSFVTKISAERRDFHLLLAILDLTSLL